MKTLISLCLSLIFLHGVLADGLPYNHEGEASGEYVLLYMDDAQLREVDTHRTLTLTKPQRAMLSRLFKTVPGKLSVASSSFNDGLGEEASGDEVYSIWLRGRSIGVTYDARLAEENPEQYQERAEFISVGDPDRLIITCDSKIYRHGKVLTVGEVFALIDEMAKKIVDARARNEIVRESLGFSLPPRGNTVDGLETTPAELLKAFSVYGAARQVHVHGAW